MLWIYNVNDVICDINNRKLGGVNVKKQSFCMQCKLSCYQFKIDCYNFKMSYVISMVTINKTYRRSIRGNEKGVKVYYYKKHKEGSKRKRDRTAARHIKNY